MAYEKLQSREPYEKLSIKFGAGYSGERVILIETLLALRVILERGLFSRAGCLGARTVCLKNVVAHPILKKSGIECLPIVECAGTYPFLNQKNGKF